MIIRAGRFGYRGRVCQSDRSWLGRAISWLSFRFAFRNESRMYSSGSIAALGIVACEVPCTGMLCTPFGIYVRVCEILCGLRMYPYVHMKLRSLLIAHTWYVYVMRTTRLPKAALRVGFKGAISRYFRGIDIIFWFSDSLRVPYVRSKRNTAYRCGLFKFVTICRYYIISINNDNDCLIKIEKAPLIILLFKF